MSDHFHEGLTWDCGSIDARLNALEAECDRYKEALEAVGRKQPEVLAMLRKHGFVFEDKGGRWEKLAFTFYTDICELDLIVKNVLADPKGSTPLGAERK